MYLVALIPINFKNLAEVPMKIIFSFFIFIFSQTCISAAMRASGDWKFGLGLGVSPNYLVSLSGGGVISGVPYTTTYNFENASATSIALDFRKLNRNGWGLVTGFEYETERSVTKVIINNVNYAITSANTFKYQTNFLHFGAAYRWDIFYIPVGLTYGLTKFTPVPGASGASGGTAENGMGLYFGFGWYINDSFTIEYVSRSASTSLKFVAGANNETTTGTIGSALLGVKYFF